MITIFAFCIPILFLFLYVVFFSIEIAAVLDAIHWDHSYTRFSVTPIWEVTNIFLVFVIVSLLAFFPQGMLVWAPLLALPILVFLTVQAVRIGLVMVISYGKSSSMALYKALVVTSVLTLAILVGGTFPVFLIGQSVFSSTGWLLGIVSALVTAFVSVTTARLFLAQRRKSAFWAEAAFFGWIVFLIVIWVAGSIYFFPGISVLARFLAEKNTIILLLYVCAAGILVTLPGILFLYAMFLS